MTDPTGSAALADSAPVEALIRDATQRLSAAGIASPRVDAELLLAHVSGQSRSRVAAAAIMGSPLASLAADGTTTAVLARTFADLIERRAAREPLQHLTGRAAFRHLDLAVGPGVFVPRPETEEVARVAIDAARKALATRGRATVVDLCTGSGAIALALATEVPGTTVYAVELDATAFEWATRNVAEVSAAAGVPSVGAADTLVHLSRGDARRALGELDGTIDVVVSNPPYVPGDAVPRDLEVALHDPDIALYGLGADGLEVPRGIVDAAARLLRPGGWFVMEHAEVQDAAAREIAVATGAFTDIETRADLTGRPRMLVARRAHDADHTPEAPGAPGELGALGAHSGDSGMPGSPHMGDSAS